MLCHINLAVYYKLVFSLAQHHNYDIETIESLIPFERDIYISMLIEHLKMLEAQRDKQNG